MDICGIKYVVLYQQVRIVYVAISYSRQHLSTKTVGECRVCATMHTWFHCNGEMVGL